MVFALQHLDPSRGWEGGGAGTLPLFIISPQLILPFPYYGPPSGPRLFSFILAFWDSVSAAGVQARFFITAGPHTNTSFAATSILQCEGLLSTLASPIGRIPGRCQASHLFGGAFHGPVLRFELCGFAIADARVYE